MALVSFVLLWCLHSRLGNYDAYFLTQPFMHRNKWGVQQGYILGPFQNYSIFLLVLSKWKSVIAIIYITFEKRFSCQNHPRPRLQLLICSLTPKVKPSLSVKKAPSYLECHIVQVKTRSCNLQSLCNINMGLFVSTQSHPNSKYLGNKQLALQMTSVITKTELLVKAISLANKSVHYWNSINRLKQQ